MLFFNGVITNKDKIWSPASAEKIRSLVVHSQKTLKSLYHIYCDCQKGEKQMEFLIL